MAAPYFGPEGPSINMKSWDDRKFGPGEINYLMDEIIKPYLDMRTPWWFRCGGSKMSVKIVITSAYRDEVNEMWFIRVRGSRYRFVDITYDKDHDLFFYALHNEGLKHRKKLDDFKRGDYMFFKFNERRFREEFRHGIDIAFAEDKPDVIMILIFRGFIGVGVWSFLSNLF